MLADQSIGTARCDLEQPGLRIWRGFISEDERRELLAWALDMKPHLNSNGVSRQFCQTEALPFVPDIYQTVRLRLQGCLGLRTIEREPMFGWYLSIIDQGGAVHSHIDPVEEGRRHLRCNLFLQVPDTGGHPVIEGQIYEVDNCDLLAFFPSEKRHRSQIVEGDRERAICSFGYVTDKDYRLPGRYRSMHSIIDERNANRG